jgi:hypothetical protein
MSFQYKSYISLLSQMVYARFEKKIVYRLNLWSLLLLFSCSPQNREGNIVVESRATDSITTEIEATESHTKLAIESKNAFKSIDPLQGRVQLELPERLRPMDEEMFPVSARLQRVLFLTFNSINLTFVPCQKITSSETQKGCIL